MKRKQNIFEVHDGYVFHFLQDKWATLSVPTIKQTEFDSCLFAELNEEIITLHPIWLNVIDLLS